MKIKTTELQDMLSKVVKGVGNNKLIPLTSMLMIKVVDGNLLLTATDATNYLTVQTKVDSDNFYAVVNADLFNKLVSKFTSDFTDLSVVNSALQIVGNGVYTLELQFDENGAIVNFPEPIDAFYLKIAEVHTIKLASIKKMLLSNKPALADTLEVPVYTGYYVDNRVVTTDTTKICESKLNGFNFSKPVLFSRQFVDLLDVLDSEDVDISFVDNEIVVSDSNGTTVYGRLMDGVESYQITAIDGLLNQGMAYFCVVNKNQLVNVLDRISLFVDTYDNGSIKLSFETDGLHIMSMKNNASESIPYVETASGSAFDCLVDVNMLLEQVKANPDDNIKVEYGSVNAIKLIGNGLIQVIALLEQ